MKNQSRTTSQSKAADENVKVLTKVVPLIYDTKKWILSSSTILYHVLEAPLLSTLLRFCP